MLCVLCNDRQWHNFGGLRRRGCRPFHCHLLDVCDFQFDGWLKLLLFRRLRFLLCQTVFDIAQYAETGFGVVQHVPGLSATCFNRLHVVLNTDYGVRESVGFTLRQAGDAFALQRNRY